MSILSDRIKQERQLLELSREDLSKKIGVSYSAIAMYERAEREPNNDIIMKMSDVFGCSVDYLMGNSDYRTIDEELDKYLERDLKLTVWKTVDRYYYEYIVPCELKEEDINCIIDILLPVRKNDITISPNEIRNNLNEFLNSFNVEKKKKLKDFVKIILEELVSNSKSQYRYHSLMTLVEQNQNKSVNFHSVPIVGKIAAGQPILAEEYLEGYLPVEPNIYGLSVSDDLFYLRVSGQSMNMRVKNGDYALIHKQEYAENGDIVVAIVNGDDEATLKRYKKLNEQFVLLEPMSTDPTIEPITVDLKDTKFQIIGKAIGHFGKF